MFRHEKRFENAPGLAITITDKMTAAEVDARLEKTRFLIYERVGLTLRANLVALSRRRVMPLNLRRWRLKLKPPGCEHHTDC